MTIALSRLAVGEEDTHAVHSTLLPGATDEQLYLVSDQYDFIENILSFRKPNQIFDLVTPSSYDDRCDIRLYSP